MRLSAALLCRSKKSRWIDWTRGRNRALRCGNLAFYLLGDDRPMVAGYACGDRPLSVPHVFASSTERLNDQVQARVYLARRVYADTESARQNTDQGIRLVSDPRAIAAVGL